MGTFGGEPIPKYGMLSAARVQKSSPVNDYNCKPACLPVKATGSSIIVYSDTT